jgi:hypothetical protein
MDKKAKSPLRKAQKKPTVMRRCFGVMCGPSDLSTNKFYRRNWNKKRP